MTTETRAGGAWRIAVLAGRGGTEDVKERCMRPRSLHCLSAVLAVCVLLPVAVRAQVIPFAGNFGQGLAPSDNQMIFESVARLNALGRARSASPTRGVIQRPRHGHLNHTSGVPLGWHGLPPGAPSNCRRKPPPRDYRFTWCRTPSGEWKIKS
jgi:hypothetical protein